MSVLSCWVGYIVLMSNYGLSLGCWLVSRFVVMLVLQNCLAVLAGCHRAVPCRRDLSITLHRLRGCIFVERSA